MAQWPSQTQSLTQCWRMLVLKWHGSTSTILGLHYTLVNYYTQARRKTFTWSVTECVAVGVKISGVPRGALVSLVTLLEIERVALITSPRVRIFRLFTQTRYQGPVCTYACVTGVYGVNTHHQPLPLVRTALD